MGEIPRLATQGPYTPFEQSLSASREALAQVEKRGRPEEIEALLISVVAELQSIKAFQSQSVLVGQMVVREITKLTRTSEHWYPLIQKELSSMSLILAQPRFAPMKPRLGGVLDVEEREEKMLSVFSGIEKGLKLETRGKGEVEKRKEEDLAEKKDAKGVSGWDVIGYRPGVGELAGMALAGGLKISDVIGQWTGLWKDSAEHMKLMSQGWKEFKSLASDAFKGVGEAFGSLGSAAKSLVKSTENLGLFIAKKAGLGKLMEPAPEAGAPKGEREKALYERGLERIRREEGFKERTSSFAPATIEKIGSLTPMGFTVWKEKFKQGEKESPGAGRGLHEMKAFRAAEEEQKIAVEESMRRERSRALRSGVAVRPQPGSQAGAEAVDREASAQAKELSFNTRVMEGLSKSLREFSQEVSTAVKKSSESSAKGQGAPLGGAPFPSVAADVPLSMIGQGSVGLGY